MKPLISICIPTYNGAKHLRECLDSVLTQTFGDFEVLLVDDGSSDDTFSIAREYAARDKRIRLEQNEFNLGLVNNWNRCVELSKGEWIKFVFQDDFIKETCIEKLLNSTDSKTLITCCRRDFLFEGNIELLVRNFYLNILSLDKLFPGKTEISPLAFCNAALDNQDMTNFIGEPTNVMLHRNAFYRVGKFIPHFVSLCDYEYWTRVAIHAGLSYVPETLSTFRVHKLATTAFNIEKRIFRKNYLDKLLILHEFNFNPLYEPIRAEAAKRDEPIDLINVLAYNTRMAFKVASAGDKKQEDSRVQRMEEWKDIMRYYPILEIFSKKVFFHSKTLKKFMKNLKVA